MPVDYRLTDHAHEEMERRSIPLEILERVLTEPEQIVEGHKGRKTYQSRVEINDRQYLIRAIIEETDPITVVTVYRTSKIDKYWSESDESHL